MTMLDDRLADLAPISLADLVDRAALLDRVDRKYVLTDAAPLVMDVLTGTLALEIDGSRRFGYASCYVDTAELDCFRMAALRRRRRVKVRYRTYQESGHRWAEVKVRGARGRTAKHREPLGDDSCGGLGRMGSLAASGFVAAVLDREGFDLDVAGLAPSLGVEYLRSTFFDPVDAVRITVDTGLRWTVPTGVVRTADRLTIVETKSVGNAGRFDRELWRRGVRPAKFSKYATGLALLTPGLPDSPWRRTIRRHHLVNDELRRT